MSGGPTSKVLIGSLAGADAHDTGTGHPECAARLSAAMAGIEDADLGSAVGEFDIRPAKRAELARVHDEPYLDAIARFIRAGGGNLDPDTPVSEGSWVTALAAAGAGLAAIEALDAGRGDAAFVIARPPGHHATRRRAMGFCIINNIAVAAAALAERGERVLIVDWDVHHGNGTQEIFWNDPRVLYVSTHEWPAYPGTGRAWETGGDAAPGMSINFPFPAGTSGDAARTAIDEVVAPAVETFAPSWVLISAGFDAHREDPLAGLEWSAGDYADLTRRVVEMAPGPGRVIGFLEGGYALGALRRSVGATVAALAGKTWKPEPATNGGPGREVVTTVARMRARLEGELG